MKEIIFFNKNLKDTKILNCCLTIPNFTGLN